MLSINELDTGMNDFTKDELEDIKELASEFGNIDLYEKTKSMIDNYCDKPTCNNCGKIREGKYEDEFWQNGHWTDGGVFCGQWRK